MATYEVAVPIVSGFQVFTVDADSEDEAKNKVIEGNFAPPTEFDNIELDYNKATMDAEKVDG